MTQEEHRDSIGETPNDGEISRAIANIERNAPPVSYVPRQDTPLNRCPTNLDMTTQRGRALALRAASPGTISFKDDQPIRMLCTAWIITPDMQADEQTGEVREFARVTLFNEHGQHFRTTAAHAPFRLKAMMELYTQDEWAKGIPLIIEIRKSRRGTTYHDINIDVENMK